MGSHRLLFSYENTLNNIHIVGSNTPTYILKYVLELHMLKYLSVQREEG